VEAHELIKDAFGRIRDLVNMSLKDLTVEQLAFRPDEQANSAAWLAWHLTRVQDGHMSDLAGREQAWVSEGWHEKFGKAANPGDTGFGYTSQQVAELRPSGPKVLVDYHQAVYARSVEYVGTLTAGDLDRVLNEPRWNPMPTVGVRLVSVCSDNLQHAGQLAYLRGIIERRHWFPA